MVFKLQNKVTFLMRRLSEFSTKFVEGMHHVLRSMMRPYYAHREFILIY